MIARLHTPRTVRRFLLVAVHPVPESFIAALAAQTIASLRGGGHEVRVIDLYGEGFSPVMTRDEWRNRDSAGQWDSLRAHSELLHWADALVFVYPTWVGGLPAILKGWFDRVWGVGIAYSIPQDGSKIGGMLKNIRSVDVVTCHGSGKWMNSAQGEPGKRMMMRGIRSVMSWRCRCRWHAFYGNDSATDADRRAFLDHVSTVMSAK